MQSRLDLNTQSLGKPAFSCSRSAFPALLGLNSKSKLPNIPVLAFEHLPFPAQAPSGKPQADPVAALGSRPALPAVPAQPAVPAAPAAVYFGHSESLAHPDGSPVRPQAAFLPIFSQLSIVCTDNRVNMHTSELRYSSDVYF